MRPASDLFSESVPFELASSVFNIIGLCPRHTFMVTTKNPQRMLKFFEWIDKELQEDEHRQLIFDTKTLNSVNLNPPAKFMKAPTLSGSYPLSNLWLGTSIQDQETADDRIPLLIQCPAFKRFVSVETLLSKTNISRYLSNGSLCECGDRKGTRNGCTKKMTRCNKGLRKVNLVIAGAKTYNNGGYMDPGRAADPDWVINLDRIEDLQRQCKLAGAQFLTPG